MASRPGFDPRLAALAPRPNRLLEPALGSHLLHPKRLIDLFQRAAEVPDFPQWSPELTHDRRRPLNLQAREETIPAAVLITVIADERPQVVLTTRTAHLASHAGQISFPGGRAEPGDQGPPHTALREAQEEIGLEPSRLQVLGSLPQYITVTGYQVTPVVALMQGPSEFKPDPFEVEDVFCVPLEFLMNPENHQLRTLDAAQSPTQENISFYAMPYCSPDHAGKEFFIWGATAAMIRNFYHFLVAASSQAESSSEKLSGA
jgi:8-oxo-dGTP pyrophosphatase MutT (NUDIX family)